MSGRDQPDWETDTVPTPRVRVEPPPSSPPPAGPSSSDTLEMPAVPASSPRTAPARQRPSGSGRRERPGPARRPAGPAPRRSRSRPARLAAVVGALVVAAGVGVLAGRLVPPAADAPVAASGGGSATVEVTWSSVDPVGGSGFRQVDDQTWRTQSYRTAEFGNLKPGVGLLADLGEAREVAAVTVDVAPVGVVVELRAGDSASQDPEDYAVVSRADEDAGPLTLDAAEGGSHRYWLLWVSQLGPREGGYVAELSEPAVRS